MSRNLVPWLILTCGCLGRACNSGRRRTVRLGLELGFRLDVSWGLGRRSKTVPLHWQVVGGGGGGTQIGVLQGNGSCAPTAFVSGSLLARVAAKRVELWRLKEFQVDTSVNKSRNDLNASRCEEICGLIFAMWGC